jgi:hypothetical protein
VAAAVALLVLVLSAPGAGAQGALPPTIDVTVPQPPVPASAGGKTHLVYELHVTNLGVSDLRLTRVDVVADDASARLLARYATGELNSVIDRPGITASAPSGAADLPPSAPDRRSIGGGLRAVVRIWVTLDSAVIPPALRHRVSVETTAPTGATVAGVVETWSMLVRRQPTLTLEPPFRGGTWYAANGPSNSSVHRRTLLAVHGRARIAQRFAIDWIKLGDDGTLFTGDPSRNESWHAYGQEVLAAADGIVTAVKDGIPDNTPLSPARAVPITLETVAGNHVIVEHERGRYGLYAHLVPGSLLAKLGERVRRGQVLGRLGNSGNSDAPHIHFHLCDANSPLGCEGLPYVMERFEVLGRLELPDDLRKMAPWSPAPGRSPEVRTREIPLENELVRFPAPPARR